jgi:methionine aminotransferase
MQLGIAAFLRSEAGQEHLAGLSAMYSAKRNRLLNGIRDTRWRFRPAEGGFFQTLSYEGFLNAPDGLVTRAWTRSADIRLATIPVSAFYDARHPMRTASTRIRICFAKGDDTIDLAAEKLRWIAANPEAAEQAVQMEA